MKTRKFNGSTSFATSAMLSLLVVSMHIASFEWISAHDQAFTNEVVAQVQAKSPLVSNQNIETIVVTATRL